MSNLFEEPILEKKVRDGVKACKYINGCINIDGYQYHGYSMTEAIQRFRQKYPKYKRR